MCQRYAGLCPDRASPTSAVSGGKLLLWAVFRADVVLSERGFAGLSARTPCSVENKPGMFVVESGHVSEEVQTAQEQTGLLLLGSWWKATLII